MKIIKGVHLDTEWVELMKAAKRIGITIEEIRLFFSEEQKRG